MKSVNIIYKKLTQLLILMGCAIVGLSINSLLQANWKPRSTIDEANNAMEMDIPSELELNIPATETASTPPTATPTAEKKTAEPATANQNKKDGAEKATATEKPAEEESENDVSFNFQEASLANLINYMAEMRQLNLIPSPETAEVKVSLNMREIVNKEKAWEVFTTLLEVSGFCIVKSGILHKVVRKDAKQSEPHPIYFGVPAETLPKTSQTIRYVLFLKNIGAQEAEGLLKNFLDPKAQIITQQTMNALIITDRSELIKHALSILKEIDGSGVKETCQIIRLSNSNASEVKKFLDELIKKPETSGLARLLGQQSEGSADFFPGNVKLIVEERTNSLIMLGTPNSLKKLENFITEYFEGNWRIKTPFVPYECQYTEAEQVKTILDDIIQAESAAAKGGSSRGGARYLGNVRIEADKYSNKLIIYSQDQKDLELVQGLLSDLDKPQPMVALETLIVQVTQTDNKSFGGQMRSKTAGQPINGIDFQAGTMSPIVTTPSGSSGPITSILGDLMSVVKSAGQGSTILTLGNKDKNDVWAVFKAVKEMDNSNVIANPFITVANRVKGTLNIGERRRIAAEKTQGDGALTGFINADAATSVNFTPQISPDGLISLEMDVKINEFQGSEGNTTNKELRTNVTMSDGQILILGGFIKTKVSESQSKTPGFGDIPLFGWLAKFKSRAVTKSYIFIFVSPTIVKPRQAPGSNLYTKIKMHDAANIVEESADTKKSIDPINNLFFNYGNSSYSHKIIDFANARYQPTTVDLKKDPVYRGKTLDANLPDQIKEVSNQELLIGPDNIKITTVKTKTNLEPNNESMVDENELIEKTTIKKAEAKTQKVRQGKKIALHSKTPSLDLLEKMAEKKVAAPPTKIAAQAVVTKEPAAIKVIDLVKKIEKPQLTTIASDNNKSTFTLKPIKDAEESTNMDLELSSLINKSRTRKTTKILGSELAQQSPQAEEEAWDEELDAVFTRKKANTPNIKISSTKAAGQSKEHDLSELFSSPKTKKLKNRAHALEKDLDIKPSKKVARNLAFSRKLEHDTNVNFNNDNDDDGDYFEQHMASNRKSKKQSKSRMQLDEDEIEIIQTPNKLAANDKPARKLSREERFKQLVLANKQSKNQDETEGLEI